jgi:hypothetical protein
MNNQEATTASEVTRWIMDGCDLTPSKIKTIIFWLLKWVKNSASDQEHCANYVEMLLSISDGDNIGTELIDALFVVAGGGLTGCDEFNHVKVPTPFSDVPTLQTGMSPRFGARMACINTIKVLLSKRLDLVWVEKARFLVKEINEECRLCIDPVFKLRLEIALGPLKETLALF